MFKIGGFDGTRRWKCIIADFLLYKFCFSHFLVELVIGKMWKIELRFI